MKYDQPILLVDNSNTRTKCALATADGMLCEPMRYLPTAQISPENVHATLTGWDYGQVVLCSVAPTAAAVLRSVFAKHPIHNVSHADCPQLLRLYENPACVGPDRLANAAALALHYCLPALAVDMGTACTFDTVVLEDGLHTLLGGAIAPGLRALAAAPALSTQLLPQLSQTELAERINSPLARDTRHALRAGILIGYEEMLHGIAQRVQAQVGTRVCTVVTGGDALWCGVKPEWADYVDHELTMKGMLALAQGKIR